MKFYKTLIASALLAATGTVQAIELSANVAAQSNYLFRGVTQTDDGAAVSGGIDMGTDTPFYLGTWMSNVDFGDGGDETVEVDLYGGIGGDIGTTGLSYDLSAWYYWYPGGDHNQLDYAEASGSLGYGWFTASIAYTFWADAGGKHSFNSGDAYYSLSVAPPWEYQGFTTSAMIGTYQFDDDGDCRECDFNYTNWGISVAKDAGDFGSFSVNYEQTDDKNDATASDDPQFWVGWAKGF